MSADTHDEFTIRWKDGAYYVTTPNLESMRVVPKARLKQAEQRIEFLDDACNGHLAAESEAFAQADQAKRERNAAHAHVTALIRENQQLHTQLLITRTELDQVRRHLEAQGHTMDRPFEPQYTYDPD